jgi:IS5 family transposase
LERLTSHMVCGGGANKEKRLKAAARDYRGAGRDRSCKVRASLLNLGDQAGVQAHRDALEYFHRMLDKHLDLVARRRLQEQTIPAAEKVFSLFAPHPEWIQKGKRRPNVEWGRRLRLATGQHRLIPDYDTPGWAGPAARPVGGADADQSVPVTDRRLGRCGAGQIASLSFDKGFTRAADRELLSLYVPPVVTPKRGKKNAAETEREGEKKLVALRRAPSAVESDINSLEHHGLNRCLDVGRAGYPRYVGDGVMSYNPHGRGRELPARAAPLALAA